MLHTRMLNALLFSFVLLFMLDLFSYIFNINFNFQKTKKNVSISYRSSLKD